MMKSRRLIALLAILSALGLLAAACNDVAEDPDDPDAPAEPADPDDDDMDDPDEPAAGVSGEITAWFMGEDERAQEIVDQYVADFEAENPDATVAVEWIPWAGGQDRFLSAIAAGDVPDVAEVGTTWTPEFAALGGLEPVSDVDPDWIESLVDAATYEGDVYGAPWYAGTRAFIYRSDIFEELGLEVPTTWDELEAAADTIREETDMEHPVMVPGDYMHMLLPMVWQAGGDIAVQENGEWVSTINDDAGVLAFETYARWHNEYASPETLVQNEAEAREGTIDVGNAAMMVGGAWDVSGAIAADPDLEGNIATAVIPAGPGGSWTFLGGSHLSVFADGENKETAEAFREFLLRPDEITKWTDEFGFWAGTVSGIDESELLADPIQEAFGLTVRDHTRVYPVTPAWAALEVDPKPQTVAIQNIIEGADAQSELDALAEEIERLLNQ